MVQRKSIEYTITEFRPTLFRLAPKEFALTKGEKTRLLFRYVTGGYILICINGGAKKKIVGYAWLKRNYLNKYPFMEKKDFIINPYYISPEYRNNGYGKALIGEVIKSVNYKIFAIVETDNVPSISVLKNNGFREKGFLKKEKWGSFNIIDEPTAFILFER